MPKEDHPFKYHELVRKLKQFGVSEVSAKRSGVVRQFVGIIEGRKQGFTLHVHSEHMEIKSHYIRAIRDRFKIPAEQFYEG